MHTKTFTIRWAPVLLLAALLLGGCARGDRARNGISQPAGQAPQATEISDPVESDLNDLDKALGDLEQELQNTDTQVEIP
jgi:hypothetical protein